MFFFVGAWFWRRAGTRLFSSFSWSALQESRFFRFSKDRTLLDFRGVCFLGQAAFCAFKRTKRSPIFSFVFSTGYVVQCPVLVFLFGKPARRNKHQQTERERESGLSGSGLSREELFTFWFSTKRKRCPTYCCLLRSGACGSGAGCGSEAWRWHNMLVGIGNGISIGMGWGMGVWACHRRLVARFLE